MSKKKTKILNQNFYTEKDFPHIKNASTKQLLNKTWNWSKFNRMTKNDLIKVNKVFTNEINKFVNNFEKSKYYQETKFVKGENATLSTPNAFRERDILKVEEYNDTEYKNMSRRELLRIVADNRQYLSNKTISLQYYKRVYLPQFKKEMGVYLSKLGIKSPTKLIYSKEFMDRFWKLRNLLDERDAYAGIKNPSDPEYRNMIIDEIVDSKGNLKIMGSENDDYIDIINRIEEKIQGLYEENEENEYEISISQTYRAGRKR